MKKSVFKGLLALMIFVLLAAPALGLAQSSPGRDTLEKERQELRRKNQALEEEKEQLRKKARQETGTQEKELKGTIKEERQKMEATKDKSKEEAGKLKAGMKEKKEQFKAEREERYGKLKEDLAQIDLKKVENRKAFAKRLIEVTVNNWERRKNNVAVRRDLSDEEKSRLTAKINEAITALKAEVPKIDVLKTVVEFKEYKKSLRALIDRLRDGIRQLRKEIHEASVSRRISRLEERLGKAETKLAELKAGGRDVTAVESLVAAAKDHLAQAKTVSGEEKIVHLKAAHDSFQKAREQVQGLGD